ncbi:MAG: hypothetical protein ACTSYP_01575 [Candidatus Heimdallarchaeaceae archaeon]
MKLKIKKYNKFLLFISLILIIFIFHTLKISQSDYVLKLDSLNQLDQECIFEYNSTYTYKTFYLEFDGIKLTKFNRLTLFFISSGDRTTFEGLKITFFWNDTIIKFTINRLFQDHQEHNISKSFTSNSNFAGTINATVVCEGQSSKTSSGSLTILNSTFMEKVTVPTLLETPTKLPSVPNWLTLPGNFFFSDSDSIETAIYNTYTNLRTNLSISFTTNSFSAFAQTIEIYSNFERLKILNFQGLEKKIYCSFQLEEGINIISIVFTINNSMGIIEISNIELEAYAYSLENSLPDSVYDWFFWEDEIAEYAFDISSFKHVSNSSEQIMHIKLDYGYTGIIPSSINYNLYSGEENICQGEFHRMEQILPTYEEIIDTYTTLYFQNLTLKVTFSTEGEGSFFLLNSSSINVETIPLLDEHSLERVLEEEKVILLPADGIISIHYFDVFQIPELIYSRRDFSLNFDIRVETGEPVKQVDVIVSSGIQVLIEESSFNETSFVFLGKISLIQIYSVIHIKLVFHGEGEEVSLCNLGYVIEGSKNDEPVEESEISDVGWKPVYLVIIAEVLLMIFVFLHVILRKLLKKTTMKKSSKPSHNSLKERIWNTLDWIIVGKNRILRGFIGLVVVVLNVVNVLAMAQILDFMEQYQKTSGLLISNHVLGWAGFILLSASGMFATLIAMHFATFLTLNFAFFEDNLLKTLLMGILTVLLFSMGWTISFIIVLSNPYLFESYAPDIPTGTILLACVISMLVLSTKLAKKRAIVYRTTLLEILKKGCIITRGEEARDAVQKGVVHRLELTNIPQNEKRNKLNKIIDEKIFPNNPVSLKWLSVLSSIDIILTEHLLMDILEEEPSKEIYDKENQIFLKLPNDSSIVGKH